MSSWEPKVHDGGAVRSVVDLRFGNKGPNNTGTPPGGGDMEKRLSKLESDHALLAERTKVIGDNMEKGFDRLSKQIDKLPSQWDMAKIVFYVVGALMAAAIWGPRALAMLAAPGTPT